MRPFLFVYLSLCWFVPTDGYAATGTIINVSHGFRMSSNERAPERDYYVDRGARDGVHEGDLFDVVREVAVEDGVTGGQNHLIRVVLGELRVVLIGETASVARVQSQRPEAQLPVLDFSGFRIGDSVEAKSSLPSH